MANNTYDLVVIGAGPGGYVAAIRAAQLGMKVACVEKSKTLGGTCLNIGCIPSKALLDSSEHFLHTQSKLIKHGVRVTGIELDLPTMMKRKDTVVEGLTKGVEGLFRKNKIDRYFGTGRIKTAKGDQKSVEVVGEKTDLIETKKILLATGSVSVELPFLKFDGKRIVSSTEALCLKEVPKSLIVVGGGFIGLELGSVWLRLGAKVTVVEFQDRILPQMDSGAVKELYKSLQKQGMNFKLQTKCLGAKVSPSGVSLQVEELTTKTQLNLDADVVLVATGRKPYSAGVGLQEAGIAVDERGFVKVDQHYETEVKGIYAIGDLIPGPMLAHKAEDEGMAVIERMNGVAGHVNYDAIPGVVYTWPELAAVGKTEEELKTKDYSYRVGQFPFLANGRAKAMEETEGFVKVLADASTDRVLGVHIVGPRASDMISEAVTVMEFGGSAEDIARTCHGHPTLSEVMKEAALAVDKRAIHI